MIQSNEQNENDKTVVNDSDCANLLKSNPLMDER